jgi:carbon monoxide dehydrogenase subunit G
MAGLAVLLAAGMAFAETEDPSAARTWTSGNGQTLTASFVKLEYDRVHLQKDDGTPVIIGMKNLIAEDQQLARTLAGSDSESDENDTGNGTAKLSTGGLKRAAGGMLTEDEIDELLTQWEDPKSGKKVVLSLQVSQVKPPNRAEQRRYAKKGEIPFRMTAGLYEIREEGGRQVQKRLDGKARFYLTDSEGKVVLKKSAALGTLCPS